MKDHYYHTKIEWTGNKGSGTADYKSYERSHVISSEGKAEILGSSDPAFRGDKARYNPEDLLVSSLSACHMLWFLHLCAVNGIIITAYTDNATGIMEETADGGGHFKEVILKPTISVMGEIENSKIEELHHQANKLCFIANSCNFPVRHKSTVIHRSEKK